ncbi:DUF488 domain-containing protein [Alloalcanivorax mobilis]|uniref:DUF488 domain-containing protein n=1 Tax=Alloalcanivorax mobilis TaxID=2019569 RepID=UPI000C77F754|nr:DUF488 domain-containing protein [Alloalcanivorax mobilis]
MLIHTAGYEGVDIETFVGLLLDANVDQVIDVRQYPISRKRGFSKTALSKCLAGAGIDYCHLRELGCPKPIRERYKQDGNWVSYEKDFLRYIDTQTEALQRMVAKSSASRSCLICFEADAAFCHRRLVAEASRKLQPCIVINHLLVKKSAGAL